ncbi:sugar ABC transporter permease [Microlunatus elymi]|uniref:Sugar ABC transporter permease n=1 Tax=Microlunatus elymi TaxID=2596828 RepID=A0A516Q1V7_9ACTN|nr:sugar ABC transporter permease [Microlunatus elymi]QDP97362.1 sugar ABC transporter permease [Microlunatus elymi]
MITRRRRAVRRTATGYALLAPSMIGIGLFLIIPVFVAIAVSFQSWNIISPPKWLGPQNYISVLSDPDVWHSFLVTVQYTLLVIPTQTLLGLGLAVLLSKKLPGSPIFRVIFVMPWVCAPLTLGVVWKWIFAPTGGALNTILGIRFGWLSDLRTALPAVAFVSVWTQVGYVALFYLAGLSGVPKDIQDAARVDGAGELGVFWRITMPLLRPTTFFVLATSIISSFQVFDTIYAMTSGGPGVPGRTDVIAHRIYNLAFERLDLGQASALSVLLMLVLVVVTVVQQLYFRRRITYDVAT